MAVARSRKTTVDLRGIPCVQALLFLLLGKARSGEALQARAWDFAVSLADVQLVRVPEEILQSMLRAGYLLHAIRTTPQHAPNPQFRHTKSLKLAPESHFLLAPHGRTVAEELTLAENDASPMHTARSRSHSMPHWDRPILWFRGKIVKEFSRSAPNQEAILDAEEESHWPAEMDDPLSPKPGLDTAERLRETAKSLNRHQQNHLLHFSVRADGKGIRWREVEPE